MTCHCQIIPNDVLERLAKDTTLSSIERKAFADAALISAQVRKVRLQAAKLTSITSSLGLAPVVAVAKPAVTVSNCNHSQTLPGTPVTDPATSADDAIKRAAVESRAVADFFNALFGRNSIDNAGMTLSSSVHYGVNYNNAFWNGSRMTYGDGDNNIFVDFTKSTDVIAHELTHGITQFTAHFAYSSEAGGLNESMSDVFGSMFRQWRADQNVNTADWLIGKDIMGPGSIARGFTCLRDMASPAAKHCLAPQPFLYNDYKAGMDPHKSSGIPNFAFYKIAKALGGNSWDKAGQIWYKALTGFAPKPYQKMKVFANRTRTLAASMYPDDVAVANVVNDGWDAVGL